MTTTAYGVISRTTGAPALAEEFLIDPPGPGEVLVRIQASGVCHTDLHVKMGTWPGFPFLLGHEGAGIVEAVGPGVTRPEVGEYVILAWRAPCGNCRFCLQGQPHLCAASLNAQPRMRTKDGIQLNPVLGIGTFCTHTVVAASQAVPAPREVPPAQACLIGCGVMTGVGAALYAADIRPGSSVAVIGCGGVGISVIQGAKIAGAKQIIGVDIADNKLAWAKEFGATDVVDARVGDVVDRIKALTPGGHGVNYSFECVGMNETLANALFCRDLAGTCVLIGVSVGGPSSVLQMSMPKFFDLGGILRTSWYGDCLPSRDFPLLSQFYLQGSLNLDGLITRRIKIEETEDAFAAMERGETLRSVIMF